MNYVVDARAVPCDVEVPKGIERSLGADGKPKKGAIHLMPGVTIALTDAEAAYLKRAGHALHPHPKKPAPVLQMPKKAPEPKAEKALKGEPKHSPPST